MVTGEPLDTSVKTEAFDLDDSKTCQSLPNYPISVAWASGAFVNSRLLICGGAFLTTNHQKLCYSIGPNEIEWTLSGELAVATSGAASLEINDTLLIMGGVSGYSQTRTAIFDAKTGTSTEGPNMEYLFYHSCAVKINSTTVLITGGYTQEIRTRYLLLLNPFLLLLVLGKLFYLLEYVRHL